MKRTSSIILLFTFCFFSFAFKTHYCNYINTDIRFHGDCNHEMLSAKEKGQYADVNFFPNHYHCDNYYKDAKPDLAKAIAVKSFSDIIAIINSDGFDGQLDQARFFDYLGFPLLDEPR